jgi:hypothetical protein
MTRGRRPDSGGVWYWAGLTVLLAACVWVVYASLDFSRF